MNHAKQIDEEKDVAIMENIYRSKLNDLQQLIAKSSAMSRSGFLKEAVSTALCQGEAQATRVMRSSVALDPEHYVDDLNGIPDINPGFIAAMKKQNALLENALGAAPGTDLELVHAAMTSNKYSLVDPTSYIPVFRSTKPAHKPVECNAASDLDEAPAVCYESGEAIKTKGTRVTYAPPPWPRKETQKYVVATDPESGFGFELYGSPEKGYRAPFGVPCSESVSTGNEFHANGMYLPVGGGQFRSTCSDGNGKGEGVMQILNGRVKVIWKYEGVPTPLVDSRGHATGKYARTDITEELES